jgi:hypothetical protein
MPKASLVTPGYPRKREEEPQGSATGHDSLKSQPKGSHRVPLRVSVAWRENLQEIVTWCLPGILESEFPKASLVTPGYPGK